MLFCVIFQAEIAVTDTYSGFKVIAKGIKMKTCFFYGNFSLMRLLKAGDGCEIRLNCLCVCCLPKTKTNEKEKYLFVLGTLKLCRLICMEMNVCIYLCELLFCSYLLIGEEGAKKALFTRRYRLFIKCDWIFLWHWLVANTSNSFLKSIWTTSRGFTPTSPVNLCWCGFILVYMGDATFKAPQPEVLMKVFFQF